MKLMFGWMIAYLFSKFDIIQDWKQFYIYVFTQPCQPRPCSPVYSDPKGPDALYFEITDCTNDVADFTDKVFPGRVWHEHTRAIKAPAAAYLAEVYYTSKPPDNAAAIQKATLQVWKWAFVCACNNRSVIYWYHMAPTYCWFVDLALPEQDFVTRLTLEQEAVCNADDIEVIDLKMHSSCILEQVSCNLCQSTLSCLACFLNFMIFHEISAIHAVN